MKTRNSTMVWALCVLLVSLTLTAIPTVMGDPQSPPWDSVYAVDNIYPEDATPSWTLESDSLTGSATATRSFAESGDILRQNFSNSGGGYEEAIKFYRTSMSYSRIDGMTLYARMSLNYANSSNTEVYGGVGVLTTQGPTTALFRALVLQDGGGNYRLNFRLGGGGTAQTNDYVTISLNQLYEVKVVFRPTTTERADIETYVNDTLVSSRNHWVGQAVSKAEILTTVTGSSAIALEWDLDWTAIGYSDDVKTSSELEDIINDLEDEIASLKRELEGLRKEIDTDIEVDNAELPTIPRTSRGNLDDEVGFVDPYRTLTYSTLAEGSGSSVALYRPYPNADEVMCIDDNLWIGGSFNHLYINTTSGTEVLNTTTAYTHVSLDCQNLTVESNAAGSLVLSRITDVRLIDAFTWGENLKTGLFSHRSQIENDMAYDWSSVRVFWAFPTEDSNGATVHIDMSSVQFWDADNNLELERGRNFEFSDAGLVCELAHANTSGSTQTRTFEITFTRETYVEKEEYFVIRDGDISNSDAYNNAPYTTNLHFTAFGTARFEGKLIIRFDLNGKYQGKRLNVRTLIIKRSDSSLHQDFTYDSIAEELRITDQSIEAGSSVTYTLYWDWLDETGMVWNYISGQPLIAVSLIGLLAFGGFFILLTATKEQFRRKVVGVVLLVVDLLILILVLVLGAV